MKISKRKLQKDQTREEILQAALHEFASRGFIATRTSDVADVAGVSHGTVFAHFATREDLLIAAIEEFGRKVAGRIHELASRGGSVREVLQAHLEGLIEEEAFYSRMVSERSLLPANAQSAFVAIQSAISIHLNQAASREIASGAIRPIPMHFFFNTWMGLIHYYLSNADLFAPGESVLKRYGWELLEYFMSLTAP